MTFTRACLVLLWLSGCGSERPVELRFEGLVGDEPARCEGVYDAVGASSTTLTLDDLRFYVHDVRLVTSDGAEHEVALEQDGAWQDGDVALIDLVNPATECATGNATIRGTIPDGADVTGVRFVLGVPRSRNHEDMTTAPSPLNVPSMHWSWNGGYIFFRLDARSAGQPEGFAVHLGSTGCMGDGRGNVTGCTQDNRVEIELSGFDPDADAIGVDLSALLAGSDLDTDAGGPPGCKSGFDDPDCEPLFHRFGLPFAGTPAGAGQDVFGVISAE